MRMWVIVPSRHVSSKTGSPRSTSFYSVCPSGSATKVRHLGCVVSVEQYVGLRAAVDDKVRKWPLADELMFPVIAVNLRVWWKSSWGQLESNSSLGWYPDIKLSLG